MLGEGSHVYQYDYDALGGLREVVKDCIGSSFPAWSSTANYAAGDCVMYAGLKYRSLLDQSSSNEPDVTASAWEQQHAYTYDANGNRLTAPGITNSPVYDPQDRLLAYGACTYSYKSDGSLQTKTCPDGTTTYDYDSFDNLRHVTLSNGTNIDYVVDGQNRRVGKKVNGALVEGFLYRNQLQPTVWLNGNGMLRAIFVYGLRPNVPEYMVQGSTTYRLISDQVGSVRLVVNTSTGAIAERIDWDEFGNVLADNAPGMQPFGFAGGLRDLDTGLTKLGARDYDVVTGRWTEKDPLRFDGDFNLYLYTGNDPINFIDPIGLIVRFGDPASRRLWAVVRKAPEGARIEAYLESSPNEYVIYGNASLPGTAAAVTGNLDGETGHFRRNTNTCPSGLSVDVRVDSRKILKALDNDPDIAGPAGRLAHEMLHASLIDFKTTGAPLPTAFLYNLLLGSGQNGELDDIQHLFVEDWSVRNWGHR